MLLKMMFISALISLCWWRKNIILMLLSMEMLLTILFSIMTSTSITEISQNSMFMLVMMVIGSTIGLSMMVALSRLQNSTTSTCIWSMTFDKNMLNYNILSSN